MVPSEPRYRGASRQVETTVPDVREVELMVHDRDRCARRAHSSELGMLLGITLDCLVSRLQPKNQARSRIAIEVLIVKVTNSLDRQPTGFLSAFVPAHAIGNDSEPPFAAKRRLGFRFPIQVGV